MHKVQKKYKLNENREKKYTYIYVCLHMWLGAASYAG